MKNAEPERLARWARRLHKRSTVTHDRIAQRQAEAEAAYLACAEDSPKRRRLLQISLAWDSALDAAVALQARVIEAGDAEASGDPADGAGLPDNHVGSETE